MTVSSIPNSREARAGVASLAVEASWLDRLVVAACEMPAAEGEAAVVEFLVHKLSEIFPECGIGACFVPAPASTSSPDLLPAEQRLFKYVPEGEEGRAVGMDPTRLFPGFRHERVLDVEPGSTTLHLASDDPQINDDRSPMMHVIRRAVLAMSRGLGSARLHARAMQDASELRALSSHMMQAEKLASLGQLAAGVVHELNNPLTSIVAYTDWLIRKQGPNGDPDSLERLRRISESSSRILRFTRDLVAYARPSSENPVLVSIQNVIEQALAFCEHVIAQHGASVDRSFADQVPPVKGMPEQLAQVFVNLFTNACHAMPEMGGKLIVTTSSNPAGRIVVTVEDNGHGIALDHLVSIFTPFFTTKTDGRGTGLGLSIVRNIMDNHGAEIRAEHASTGGARFVLVFPAGM
ncbi:MAG: GHKL domain-containing protein [Labilithrix sp.]|nr:GHKL domain-containing protein [Labilithrix sp.]MCW5809646.1 GHKL domain-containing protein [Labilithrix sp.]